MLWWHMDPTNFYALNFLNYFKMSEASRLVIREALVILNVVEKNKFPLVAHHPHHVTVSFFGVDKHISPWGMGETKY